MDRPPPSRRSVLRAAAGLGVVGSALIVTAACGNADEGPDELEAPLAAARADAALATVAGRAFPDLAARVGPVASARRAHADALAAEVRRARPDRADAVAAPVPDPPPPASRRRQPPRRCGPRSGRARRRVGAGGARGALPQRARRLGGGRVRRARGDAGMSGTGVSGAC